MRGSQSTPSNSIDRASISLALRRWLLLLLEYTRLLRSWSSLSPSTSERLAALLTERVCGRLAASSPNFGRALRDGLQRTLTSRCLRVDVFLLWVAPSFSGVLSKSVGKCRPVPSGKSSSRTRLFSLILSKRAISYSLNRRVSILSVLILWLRRPTRLSNTPPER